MGCGLSQMGGLKKQTKSDGSNRSVPQKSLVNATEPPKSFNSKMMINILIVLFL